MTINSASSASRGASPPWMSYVLIAAAIYNLLWGAWVVFRPLDLFRLSGAAIPNYPSIWQCVGMIVGVYGIGYAIAARDPFRHWPITLVGLLGKLFGPIGFAWMLISTSPDSAERLPVSWGWTIVTNDLIWWIPFAAILYQALRENMRPASDEERLAVPDANRLFADQTGTTLFDLSLGRNVLLVFLRHSGCTFCREALADLSRQRQAIEADGTRIAVVHMSDESAGHAMVADYGLESLSRISDPTCRLYRAYELQRGKLGQLFGGTVFWRGFLAAIINRHGVGPAGGDGFQMPGAFVIRDGRIIREFRHRTAADRPDYCELARTVGD